MPEVDLTQKQPTNSLLQNNQVPPETGQTAVMPQSVEDLNKMISETQQKVKVSVWGYIILSLAFPPFTTVWAFYKANKKQVLPQVLPAVTLAFSVVIILSALSSLSTVSIPDKLSQLGISNQTGLSQSKLSLFDNLTIFSGVIGLVVGWRYRNKIKKEQMMSSSAAWLMIVIIFGQMIAVSYLFYFVYKSTYSTVAPLIQNNYQGIN